jgi:hypothetical protein
MAGLSPAGKTVILSIKSPFLDYYHTIIPSPGGKVYGNKPFAPEYAANAPIVLAFFYFFGYNRGRKKEENDYAKTWFYSRYAGCKSSDSVRGIPEQLSHDQSGNL